MHHSDKFDHHLVSSPPEFDSLYVGGKRKTTETQPSAVHSLSFLLVVFGPQ
jgi:hypothetical protein